MKMEEKKYPSDMDGLVFSKEAFSQTKLQWYREKQVITPQCPDNIILIKYKESIFLANFVTLTM
jgi:hypothetical protein